MSKFMKLGMATGLIALMSSAESGAAAVPAGKVEIVITELGDFKVFTGEKDGEGSPTFHEEGDRLIVKQSTYESLRDKGFATKYGVKSQKVAAAEAEANAARTAQLAELEQLRADKAAREQAAAAAAQAATDQAKELDKLRAELAARDKADADAKVAADKAAAELAKTQQKA